MTGYVDKKESDFVPAFRSYLRANLFDGYEGGILTQDISLFMDEVVEVLDECIRNEPEIVRSRVAHFLINRIME